MARSPETPATRALDALGIRWRPHLYAHDPRERNYGMEAARALGLDPQRVFKTLVVSLEGRGLEGRGLAVAVLPVAAQLDVRAFAHACGGKHGDLADVAVAERSTGYVTGGISPIGQRRALTTVLDDSAVSFETIFVSGGRRGFDIEVAPSDLLRACAAQTARIVRQTAS